METRAARSADVDKKVDRRQDMDTAQQDIDEQQDMDVDITTSTRTDTGTDGADADYTDILGGNFGGLGALAGCLAGGAALMKRLMRRSRTAQFPEVLINLKLNLGNLNSHYTIF